MCMCAAIGHTLILTRRQSFLHIIGHCYPLHKPANAVKSGEPAANQQSRRTADRAAPPACTPDCLAAGLCSAQPRATRGPDLDVGIMCCSVAAMRLCGRRWLLPALLAACQLVAAAAAAHEGSTNAAALFPANNTAVNATGKELQDLLLRPPLRLVVLFHLHSCVHSRAMLPVFECLPAFFSPDEVAFALVEYSGLSLMSLMSFSLHALPVLQVNAGGRKYRYSGKHQLEPMLRFVSKALGLEPLGSIEAARLCSPGQQALAAAGAGDREAAAAAAAAAAACGNWTCARWDGEATVEELAQPKHSLLLYLSTAFVAARLLWWLRRAHVRRRTAAAAAVGQSGGAVATSPGAAGRPKVE